ncbi:PQQ-binding-like beta-propeller repeat protein [Cognatishimia sp. SS12]|uniref:PQQ-like beta-propeller repeat protein n=1 Tax=Cognatishimia sp. SS12 TaxID=2979465 RepID=UPI0023303D80|nr:PQQ-like beta-propeller repeat protein [Cognatishimia sp. SS12]MDC0738542.1 PQQ-binding-like beta-propeller repeat protein [Cognatishimia sp. SS12]
MAAQNWILAAAVAGLLAGCAEREVILTGDREELRGQAPQIELPSETRAIRLAAQSSNADWTHRIGTPRYRTAHPALSSAPTLAWSASIGEGDKRRQRISTDPVVADGRIFTVDSTAILTATSTSGARLWSLDMTPEGDRATDASGGGLAVAGGKLFVSNGFGRLLAVNPATGDILWEQRLGATGNSTPTVYGDLVYLVSGDDLGWALDVNTGRIEWQLSSTPDVNNLQVPSAPAVSEKFVVFAFGSGEVQTAFRKGGLRFWDAGIQGERLGRALSTISDISGDPVIVGDTVFVANHSGRLVALDLNTGERKWTLEEGALSPVWPAGDSVFLVNEQNQLVRVDANSGTRIWAKTLPDFTKDRPRRQVRRYAHFGPIMAGGQLIVASSDGVMRSFDPTSGDLLRTTEIPGGATSNPVVAGRTLYVVNKKGDLLAFR